jgi:hypothetical protein
MILNRSLSLGRGKTDATDDDLGRVYVVVDVTMLMFPWL